MTTLIRVLIALVAALTVCVVGWAGLHAIGVKPPTVAAAPSDLQLPSPSPVPSPRANLAPFGSAVDASLSRPTARSRGEVDVELIGGTPSMDLVLRVVSGWSGAPLAQRPLDAPALADGRVRFTGVAKGSHWLTLVPAAAPTAASYLTRVRIDVPADARAQLDVTTHPLRVRVLRAGAPVARALVRLERADDPAWMDSTQSDGDDGVAWTDADGQVGLGPLGRGSYRARVVGESAPTISFEVPGTAEIEISLPGLR
ncbi:MAG: hypothetical protein R3F56_26150 [Planctomycetota bacterium]